MLHTLLILKTFLFRRLFGIKKDFIEQGRKQLADEILNDSRLNSQITETGIRIIIKGKLQKEVEGK